MSTAKEELTRLIAGQPEDSSQEEIVRELAFYVMVQRELADSERGERLRTKRQGGASAL